MASAARSHALAAGRVVHGGLRWPVGGTVSGSVSSTTSTPPSTPPRAHARARTFSTAATNYNASGSAPNTPPRAARHDTPSSATAVEVGRALFPRHRALHATPTRSEAARPPAAGASATATSGSARDASKGKGPQKAAQPVHKEEPESAQARRSMLYVPGSSEKMIKKSLESEADCIIFDLEDSVAAHRKGAAREAVLHGLNAAPRPGPELAVRINPPSGDVSIASDDLDIILPSRQLQAIVLPKVESADDVRMVLDKAQHLRDGYGQPLSLVLSVESAASLLNMPGIIEEVRSWGKDDLGFISALLFASEDYCASTGIIRTKTRRELLFPRAHMATIAKAYELAAIDMVCVDYKDTAYLSEECRDGRELGFDGKQAIHPAQVSGIQSAFSPSEADVLRAARIKHAYEQSVRDNKGAVGMKEGDSMVMIDAPMLKQADATLAKARAGNMRIPDPSEFDS